MFILIALHFTIQDLGKKPLSPKQHSIVIGCLILATLSKQVYVIYPFLFYLISTMRSYKMAIRKAHILGIFISLLLAVLYLTFYAVPFLEGKNLFSLTYFYSQLGNFVPVLLNLYIYPTKIALLHKLPWFHTFNTPPVILGGIVLSFLVAISLFRRKTVASLCVLCFLFTLIPTNTLIPKHQVILEWRLYPSLFFFVLFIGCIARSISARPLGKAVSSIVLIGVVAFYAQRTYQQNRIYQSEEDTYRQVLTYYPTSLIAYNNMGYAAFLKGDLRKAEDTYKKGLLKNRCYEPLLKSLAELYESEGDTMRAREVHFRLKMCKKTYSSPQHLL